MHGGGAFFGGIPWIKVCDGAQRLRTLEQLVQHVDNVGEAGSFGAVVQPTLEHELVDGRGAVHGSGEPEGLVDGFHDLPIKRATVFSIRKLAARALFNTSGGTSP